MPISRCKSPRSIPADDLHIIGEMYPYNSLSYTDLGEETRAFLVDIAAPKDSCVAAISAHNGLGRQWGIVLLRQPNKPDWQLVGQFGHGVRIPYTTRCIDWSYFWAVRLRLMRMQIWRNRFENNTLLHPQRLEILLLPLSEAV